MRHSADGIDYVFRHRLPANGEKSNQYVLVRALLGTIEIETASTAVTQTADLSIFPGAPQVKGGAEAIRNFLNVYGVGCSTALFIKKTTTDNRVFYRDILAEFANFFVETEKSSHTSAFVFLYRIMERLSFSIPLLYCSTSHDYVGTFADLKSMFASGREKSGEHGLFKKFLEQGKLVDPTLLDSLYRIDFSTESDNRDLYFKTAKNLSDKFENADQATWQLDIKFRDVPDFLRNLRNRFFHFRTGDGQKNISVGDLQNVHGFFERTNGVFCSFLALVVLHSIAKKYQVP